MPQFQPKPYGFSVMHIQYHKQYELISNLDEGAPELGFDRGGRKEDLRQGITYLLGYGATSPHGR